MGIELDTGRLLVLGALLFLLSLTASSETAILSLSRMQLRSLRERYKATYEIVKKVLEKPSRFLILTLLFCEILSIVISSIVTEMTNSNEDFVRRIVTFVHGDPGDGHMWFYTSLISMLVTLPLLLLIGEIPPKVLGARMNRIVTVLNVRPIWIIYSIFKPLIIPIDWLVNLLLKKMKSSQQEVSSPEASTLSEEDFMTLMEEGQREGSVNKDEREMIANVLEFDDITVEEVMTPINRVFMLADSSRIGDVISEIRNQKYSRIPVYKKNHENIIGIIHTKTLLEVMKNPSLESKLVKDLMKPALIVRTEMRLSTVFKKFKSEKTHIAICHEETERTVGIITMEDLLESIFGDIKDEWDVKQ